MESYQNRASTVQVPHIILLSRKNALVKKTLGSSPLWNLILPHKSGRRNQRPSRINDQSLPLMFESNIRSLGQCLAVADFVTKISSSR